MLQKPFPQGAFVLRIILFFVLTITGLIIIVSLFSAELIILGSISFILMALATMAGRQLIYRSAKCPQCGSKMLRPWNEVFYLQPDPKNIHYNSDLKLPIAFNCGPCNINWIVGK